VEARTGCYNRAKWCGDIPRNPRQGVCVSSAATLSWVRAELPNSALRVNQQWQQPAKTVSTKGRGPRLFRGLAFLRGEERDRRACPRQDSHDYHLCSRRCLKYASLALFQFARAASRPILGRGCSHRSIVRRTVVAARRASESCSLSRQSLAFPGSGGDIESEMLLALQGAGQYARG